MCSCWFWTCGGDGGTSSTVSRGNCPSKLARFSHALDQFPSQEHASYDGTIDAAHAPSFVPKDEQWIMRCKFQIDGSPRRRLVHACRQFHGMSTATAPHHPSIDGLYLRCYPRPFHPPLHHACTSTKHTQHPHHLRMALHRRTSLRHDTA